jgi:hypothetical protein
MKTSVVTAVFTVATTLLRPWTGYAQVPSATPDARGA